MNENQKGIPIPCNNLNQSGRNVPIDIAPIKSNTKLPNAKTPRKVKNSSTRLLLVVLSISSNCPIKSLKY